MRKGYTSILRQVCLQLLLVLSFYSLSRIIFYILYKNDFPGLSPLSYLSLAWYGLRFDLSAVCSINILYIFTRFLPFNTLHTGKAKKHLQGWFILSNTLAFLFEITDWAYFRYNHKRATAELLHMIGRKSDFWNLLPQFLTEYWLLVLTAIIWILLFVYANQKITGRKTEINGRSLKGFVFSILAAGCCLIGIRGGLQYVPIGIKNAVTYTQGAYTPILLNTPFSILSTLQNNALKEEFFFTDETADYYVQPVKQYTEKSFRPLNIVVIILESFSRDFTGLSNKTSYTPFLDSLMQKGLTCTNAQANGVHSSEGIPAILSGLPTLQEDAFMESAYASNTITSLANTLKKKGYSSAFYHGGNTGTMSFDLYTKSAGFDHYLGREAYPDDKDYDGMWGIWDHAFLPFAASDIGKRLQEPFVASVFSLSSHHPFKVPEIFKGHFPKGKVNIHETIGYTDYALRLFFETAETEKWFSNTLFLVVSDHCAVYAEDDYHMYFQGRYAIPIIFYAPGDSTLKGQYNGLCQPIDIMPSLLDYIGYKDKFFALGNSIFSPPLTNPFAVQFWYSNMLWTMNEHLLKTAQNDIEGFYALSDSLCKNNLKSDRDSLAGISLRQAKAFRQVYNRSMIRNRLFLP